MIDDRPLWTITMTVHYPGDAIVPQTRNGGTLSDLADRKGMQISTFRCLQPMTAVYQMGAIHSRALNGLPDDAIIEITARQRFGEATRVG